MFQPSGIQPSGILPLGRHPVLFFFIYGANFPNNTANKTHPFFIDLQCCLHCLLSIHGSSSQLCSLGLSILIPIPYCFLLLYFVMYLNISKYELFFTLLFYFCLSYLLTFSLPYKLQTFIKFLKIFNWNFYWDYIEFIY